MAIDPSGLVNSVILGLTAYVFGNILLTTSAIIVFFVVFSLLVKIPLPFALAVPLPLILAFVAFGYMSVAIGVLFAVGFIILSASAFMVGIGIR
jgi:hypothetical protein